MNWRPIQAVAGKSTRYEVYDAAEKKVATVVLRRAMTVVEAQACLKGDECQTPTSRPKSTKSQKSAKPRN